MSDAFRALDDRHLDWWNWHAATILFVSYDWDPACGSAESLAGRRLVQALLQAGARVHVLAANRPVDDLQHSNYGVTTVAGSPFPQNKMLRALRMVRSTIPEAEGAWVPEAVAAGLGVLASLPADTVIYGRAMPGSSNIVAWHLARATGLPWVAHFSDEWPPRHVLSKGRKWLAPYKTPLFRLWRRRIVRDSGALTFTNPWQAEEVLAVDAKSHAEKAFVVAHLPSGAAQRNRPAQYDFFHIVHTGNFYPAEHTSAALIQGLRRFLDRVPAARGRVRFTQAGWANGDLAAWTTRCGLDEVVRFAGRLSQVEVMSLLDTASLLIAVDYARPGSRTVLSKLPDYVGAGRPILAITAPSSAMTCLFSEDGVGLTAHYDSPEQVADRLSAVFTAWQRRRLDTLLPRRTAIEAFSCRRVLAELSGAFVVARRRRGVADGTSHREFELREGKITT